MMTQLEFVLTFERFAQILTASRASVLCCSVIQEVNNSCTTIIHGFKLYLGRTGLMLTGRRVAEAVICAG